MPGATADGGTAVCAAAVAMSEERDIPTALSAAASGAAAYGMVTDTTNPPPMPGPALTVPPTAATRSRMPIRP